MQNNGIAANAEYGGQEIGSGAECRIACTGVVPLVPAICNLQPRKSAIGMGIRSG